MLYLLTNTKMYIDLLKHLKIITIEHYFVNRIIVIVLDVLTNERTS
jgi:hypothetical protein